MYREPGVRGRERVVYSGSHDGRRPEEEGIERLFYEVMKFLARPLTYILFWPVITGRRNIPAKGPGIFAGNHLGVGEPLLLLAFAPPQVTFPAKRELFRTDTLLRRLGAWFLRMIHQVPLDRTGGAASIDSLGSVYDVLESGGFVGIFPEGHRSPDGRLYKGHTGVARLALTTNSPVIPFGCFRTRFVWKFLPFPWLFRPELRFGKPFYLPEELRVAFMESGDRQAAIQALRDGTELVMKAIQEITGQEMVGEYSLIHKKGPGAETHDA